ncbi:MAG TPA: N-methyl-L-tryptophan oxidase [Acetobacteraceae bacterium]|nr:N-methyl-L-tryptophan oxidase [Acetobacteraceae bacterium]
MSHSATADVIVVGLGAMGAATLARLARRGARAIGIDRRHPPHDHGSSHGETRITRLAVGEGAVYVPLARRSHALWREMEQETGKRLMLQVGGLIFGSGDSGAALHGRQAFVRHTIELAESFGISHEVLDAANIEARFPQFALRGDELGYYEPEAGMLFPEACIAAQLELAARDGAIIRTGETVHEITETGSGVAVSTDAGSYAAGEVVLAVGAWLPGMLQGTLAARARVYRQTLHWFAPEDPSFYAPNRFPVFIWMHGKRETDHFYGFPMLPGSAGVKLATEQYAGETTVETVERAVSPAESDAMYATHVAGRLHGVSGRATRSSACLYTVTPDRGFIVDRAHGQAHVHVVSACSGHGFKHSAALGEAVAAMVLGETIPHLAPFSLARFAG